jgi:hypothetical protein
VAILLWVSFLLAILFFLFLLGRFACKKCNANISTEDALSFDPDDKRSGFVWGMWIVGLFIIGSITVTTFGSIGLFNQAQITNDSMIT